MAADDQPPVRVVAPGVYAPTHNARGVGVAILRIAAAGLWIAAAVVAFTAPNTDPDVADSATLAAAIAHVETVLGLIALGLLVAALAAWSNTRGTRSG